MLTYESFKKGSNVFEWGSFGDKFYIILKGKVSVQIPQDKFKKKVNTMVKEEMLKMYVKNANLIKKKTPTFSNDLDRVS